MSSRFASEVRAQAELQQLARRTPQEWQSEALETIRSGSAPWPTSHAWVTEKRAEAIRSVLAATDAVLIRAVQAAQQNQRKTIGKARFYGPAKASAILAEISGLELAWLAVGRCRSLRKALEEAAARHPKQLWRDARGGWRSLGEHPEARAKRCRRECGGWIRDELGRRLPRPPGEV
jgi:hypothetical protein